MTAELAQQHAAFLREVLAANEDLHHRLRSLRVTAFYDREDDAFILRFGEVEDALTESVGNLLYLRLHPETLKIVGLEIPNLTRCLAQNPAIRDLWFASVQLAGADISEFPAPDLQASDRLARHIRELVPA